MSYRIMTRIIRVFIIRSKRCPVVLSLLKQILSPYFRCQGRQISRTYQSDTPPCRLQRQNGVDYRGPLGAGTIKQEEKGSSGNGRWAGEPERGRWYGTSRALNRKPMVNNVRPKYRNTLRGTYAGDQYAASGRQR